MGALGYGKRRNEIEREVASAGIRSEQEGLDNPPRRRNAMMTMSVRVAVT